MNITESRPSPTANPESPILNISTYKFVSLDRLEERRTELKNLCDSLELKGTILLSPEGINMFLAGDPAKIHAFFDELHCDPLFADIEPKESFSDGPPFRRMLVRLKKEIIAFGIDAVDPEHKTSPKLPAAELKAWLDEGRPVRLLDVRNDYEIELGTFDNAEHLDIHHFREFPQAIQRLPEEAKKQPIVMFCTGGIRCEKAGPLMEQAGFEQVYQLNGGILKYFEEVGGAHYDGSCFVFDGRVALDPALQPTGNQLCFACQAVLEPKDLESNQYAEGKYCPHCYVEPSIRRQQQLLQRQHAITAIATSQPGSQPYDNVRFIHVPGKMAGLPMIEFLERYQPAIAVDQWQRWLDADEITFEDQPVSAQYIVKEGQRFVQHMPGTIEPEINPDIKLLHEDDSLVVVNKPAPLPTHPSGRYNRNSLTAILEKAYVQQKLRVAHRIDANTTGVVVLCRKQQASRFVQPQFADQSVEKVYVARVDGHPAWDQHTCSAALTTRAGQGGSRMVDELGADAITQFQVLQRLGDGSSLLEVRPQTGRTHQIRVHAWHLGFPILGDPLYLPEGQLGTNTTLATDAEPMCLHAKSVRLCHPETREMVTYEAPLPDWAVL